MLPRDIFEFVILDLEGGAQIVNRGPAEDPGGITKYGFAQKYNTDIDVTTLTEAQAYDRANRQYWMPLHGDELSSSAGLMLFDAGFSQGVSNAIAFLQRAISVKQDGVYGRYTLLAAQGMPGALLIERLAQQRMHYWLTRNNAVEEANESGWANRLIRVLCRALTR